FSSVPPVRQQRRRQEIRRALLRVARGDQIGLERTIDLPVILRGPCIDGQRLQRLEEILPTDAPDQPVETVEVDLPERHPGRISRVEPPAQSKRPTLPLMLAHPIDHGPQAIKPRQRRERRSLTDRFLQRGNALEALTALRQQSAVVRVRYPH